MNTTPSIASTAPVLRYETALSADARQRQLSPHPALGTAMLVTAPPSRPGMTWPPSWRPGASNPDDQILYYIIV
jgi:hypothetical protein